MAVGWEQRLRGGWTIGGSRSQAREGEMEVVISRMAVCDSNAIM